MNAIELQLQADIDRDVMTFVREAAQWGPVRVDAIHSFLVNARRRKITLPQTQDRVNYLAATDRAYISATKHFEAGETVTDYTILGKGQDVLDGNLPPPCWNSGNN